MKKLQLLFSTLFAIFALSILGCKSDTATNIVEPAVTPAPPQPSVGFMPNYLKNTVIYEVNLRQYTPEGTIEAFEKHIPRLAEMGIDVLWFMPMHPISKVKRKGGLGSYYSVADYRKVNPEFGTEQEFRSMVRKIHESNMKLIIDWVPNHTGWDHPWISEHPEYYSKGKDGKITDPIDPSTGKSWGWTDVADLDFENPEMRKAMLDDMEFWVRSMGVDGFRQDVAHGVPLEFWREYKTRMSKYPQLFHLAEAETPEHRNEELFHTSYGWEFHHLMNAIAKGEKGASAIKEWYEADSKKFNKGFHMHFTSNHDENTWSGTEFDRMGRMVNLMAVLSFTLDGTPLIYSGQEEPLKKRLKFFEKDVIPFKNFSRGEFYRKLILNKHRNTALWNGSYAAEPEFIRADDEVLIFRKKNEKSTCLVAINFSDKVQSVGFPFDLSNMLDVVNERMIDMNKGQELELEPYGFRVLSNF